SVGHTPTQIYSLSLHDALPIYRKLLRRLKSTVAPVAIRTTKCPWQTRCAFLVTRRLHPLVWNWEPTPWRSSQTHSGLVSAAKSRLGCHPTLSPTTSTPPRCLRTL